MGAFHVVLMFLLVWSVTADEDDISVTCEHVTGNVGDELTLTCRVSYQSDKCCMRLYKFKNTMNDDEMCKTEFGRGSCQQRTSFTCPYTADANMTTTFSFFLQTTCGTKTTDFTVNITGGNDYGNNDQTGKTVLRSTPSALVDSIRVCATRHNDNSRNLQIEYQYNITIS